MSGTSSFSFLDPTDSVSALMTAAPTSGTLLVDSAVWRDELVLRVHGDADLATAAVLGQALVAASRESQARVVLDFAGLLFIDAYCLGVIDNARALLSEQGRTLALRSPPPLLRRMLGICAMDSLIEA